MDVRTDIERSEVSCLPMPTGTTQQRNSRPGDNVFAIAAKLGFSTDEIKELQRVYAGLLGGETG